MLMVHVHVHVKSESVADFRWSTIESARSSGLDPGEEVISRDQK